MGSIAVFWTMKTVHISVQDWDPKVLVLFSYAIVELGYCWFIIFLSFTSILRTISVELLHTCFPYYLSAVSSFQPSHTLYGFLKNNYELFRNKGMKLIAFLGLKTLPLSLVITAP